MTVAEIGGAAALAYVIDGAFIAWSVTFPGVLVDDDTGRPVCRRWGPLKWAAVVLAWPAWLIWWLCLPGRDR